MYRSPAHKADLFVSRSDKLLENILIKSHLIVLGDFNTDVTEDSGDAKLLKEMLLSHNLNIRIKDWTRVTNECNRVHY